VTAGRVRGDHCSRPPCPDPWRTLDDILANRRHYRGWVLGQDFYDDTKAVVREALGPVRL
jgi:hypothetical protein